MSSDEERQEFGEQSKPATISNVHDKKKDIPEDTAAVHSEADAMTNKPKQDHKQDFVTPQQRSSFNENKDDDNEEEDEDMFVLEEDIFSMMFITEIKSLSFGYTIIALLIQASILSLAIWDMKRDAPDDSPFKIPINVQIQVAVAQYISVMVISFMQKDIFMSLDALLTVGYDASVMQEFPEANYLKWILSNLFRMFVGVANLIAAFFIIVQADNVLDIFKDFAALHFITELDNEAFWLADVGYLGTIVKQAAEDTKKVKLARKRKTWQRFTWASIVVLVLIMISGLAWIRYQQKNGVYLKLQSARSLTVKFGDEVYKVQSFNFDTSKTNRSLDDFNFTDPPDLHYAYFSGTYEISGDGERLDIYNERPVYYERDAQECKKDPTCGMFYYCSNITAWVFTIPALDDQRQGLQDCQWGWLALSAETEAYKLEDVPSTGWRIWTGIMTKTESLQIVDDECRRDEDCNNHGSCNKNNGTCTCKDNWQGKKCDIESYCRALWWVTYGDSSSEYDLYGPLFFDTTATAYERPIYTIMYVNDSRCVGNITLEVLLYTGRRWFFTVWCPDELARYMYNETYFSFTEDFHAYWDNLFDIRTEYFSEPTESYSAIGISLFQIRESLSKGSYAPFGAHFPVKETFECMDIACQNDTMVCGDHGECVNSTLPINDEISLKHHACSCHDHYGGLFCEFSPEDPYIDEDDYKSFNRSRYENDTNYTPGFYPLSYWNYSIEDKNVDNNDEL